MIDEDETRLKSKKGGRKEGGDASQATSSCIIVLTLRLYGSTSCETGKRSWRLSPPVGTAAGSEAEPEGWSELFPRQPTQERQRNRNSRRSAQLQTRLQSVCSWEWQKKKCQKNIRYVWGGRGRMPSIEKKNAGEKGSLTNGQRDTKAGQREREK